MSPEAFTRLDHYLAQDAAFRAIYDYTKSRFDATPRLYAHNFEHARRDTINAIAIGEPEGADMHIVVCAAVLHDIGYLYGGDHREHGEVGADNLRSYLAEGDIQLSQTELEHIAACIRTHKGVMHDVEPQSLEAKVIADADHLDKLGPVGVYQVILSLNEFGYTIEKTLERFQNSRDLPFFTATGTQLAAPLKTYRGQFGQDLVAAYAPYAKDQSQEPTS